MAWLQLAAPPEGPPRGARSGGKPLPYVELYVIAAVVMVRTTCAAAASFAAILALRRLGIAIAAITNMMATTTSNSIKENPWTAVCAFDSLRWSSGSDIGILPPLFFY